MVGVGVQIKGYDKRYFNRCEWGLPSDDEFPNDVRNPLYRFLRKENKVGANFLLTLL
jgi:hypothetical protein